jgi:hypothetical protein
MLEPDNIWSIVIVVRRKIIERALSISFFCTRVVPQKSGYCDSSFLRSYVGTHEEGK